jgi:hypothetical protein
MYKLHLGSMGLSLLLFMHSLCDVHEMNAYGTDHVCLHDTTQELPDKSVWNLVWTLCYWVLPQHHTFQFAAIGNNNRMDEWTC